MMKKKMSVSRMILLVAGITCLLAALCVFLWGDSVEEVSDAFSYRQSASAGEITNETQVSQGFTSPVNGLKGIMMRVNIYGESNLTGTTIFTLSNDQGEQIDQVRADMANFTDKGSYALYFEVQPDSVDKAYVLTVQAQGMEEGKVFSLMCGEANVGGTLTYADGTQKTDMALFMTVIYENPLQAMEVIFLLLLAGVMLITVSVVAGNKKEEERHG